jgi:FkbM family methyltransferase
MKKIKKLIRPLVEKIYPFYLFGYKSYSQDGEDMMLRTFIESEYPQNYKGFYVDIGAHHPFRFSNTAYFYKKGWCGINVEPTPILIKKFYSLRKRDININAAIGTSDKSLMFYIFNEPALNSFDKELSFSRENEKYKIIDQIEVPLEKLSCILDKNLPKETEITFLTIDVEGLDLDILKSNDWQKYNPKFILIEDDIDFENIKSNKIYDYLKSKKYQLIGKTLRTSIYKRIN